MPERSDFRGIRLSIASPEQIRSWSYGEVTKPETINYRTLRPEKGGLFCERIFGPTKDYECYCGKYKKMRYKRVTCEKCGVEVTTSRVRRERMGHIELAAPVAHIWFVKVIPSRIGLLLDLSPRKLEQVIYFAKYIITEVNEDGRRQAIERLKEEHKLELMQLQENKLEKLKEAEEQGKTGEVNQIQHQLELEEARLRENLEGKVKELEELKPLQLLGLNEYRELKKRWGELFRAGMGAEAIQEILSHLDLGRLRKELCEELNSTTTSRRKKAQKRLRAVDSFYKRGIKPRWMILQVLPVLPPDLRPMVQLDGGRFATSDINDLYRRVINRNNRLKRLIELGAPEVITRNEKRMLQESVDALLDNERRSQPVTTSSGHELRSLSDMLQGKQGRFRQNLLGKRVDYSGRSVIIAGPELKLNQCGLPKRMALELFKPFVMRKLIARGLVYNIRGAKRMVEQGRPEVWDILEEVIKEHPVFLNRAPTLHRLSIQAFYPVFTEGSAIQLHPLACAAFNADFDGDQMAVHVPLSKMAIEEAEKVMLSTQNMLKPASGEPLTAPTLEMVLGCYYLTGIRPGAKGEGQKFSSLAEARLAHELELIDLQAEVEVRVNGERLRTTAGRIIFNEVLPPQLRFRNQLMDKKSLKRLVTECHRCLGNELTASMLDKIKEIGYSYATKSGITMAVSDLRVPVDKEKFLSRADQQVGEVERQFQRGLITADERYQNVVKIWTETSDNLTESLQNAFSPSNSVFMMAGSGAKGNIGQIRQMAGMRGLMSDPSGRIIELPIRTNLREGASVLEFFISTHGARKGLADTALRTSDAGYLTRRLADVAQEVIVTEDDCSTGEGIWIREPKRKEEGLLANLSERIVGRLAAQMVIHPQTHEVIVERNEEISVDKANQIVAAGITEVCVRSPLTCHAKRGICRYCYGTDLGRAELVNKGVAVGIVAAQSIGEPGTQLTLRTFHTGGIAERDITSGLPRVEELFEARAPKGQAAMAEIDGVVEIEKLEEGHKIKVIGSRTCRDEYPLPPGYKLLAPGGTWVKAGAIIAQPEEEESLSALSAAPPIAAKIGGRVEMEDRKVAILYEEKEEREYFAPLAASLLVRSGSQVKAGDQLSEGPLNPYDILRVLGTEAVQRYLVDEVQKVYRAQGVNIHDKHIEVIVAQMLRKVQCDSPGDTRILPGELIDKSDFEVINAKVLAEGGEPATAHPVLLGITRASLSTNSFLAAASFQETARVLTEAAVTGAIDWLQGLKENVIIGKLIPARNHIPLPK